MAEGTRNWKFIVWQESAPDDFEKRLEQSFMKCCYLLHDKDINDDGTPKKPHYDGVIMLDGPTSYRRMMEIMKRIAGDGINTIEECIQTSGALKYICHLASPDKYQYDPKDVICINGANYIADIQRYELPDQYDEEIIRFIETNNITQYRDLVIIAKLYYPAWYRGVSGRTLFWKGYLTSKEDKQAHNVFTNFDDVIREDLNIDY